MATVSNRALCALGPIKMEILNLTAVTTADTVTTLMQRPVFAMGVQNSGTAAATTQLGVAISGKTLTLTSSDFAGAATVNVLVFGF